MLPEIYCKVKGVLLIAMLGGAQARHIQQEILFKAGPSLQSGGVASSASGTSTTSDVPDWTSEGLMAEPNLEQQGRFYAEPNASMAGPYLQELAKLFVDQMESMNANPKYLRPAHRVAEEEQEPLDSVNLQEWAKLFAEQVEAMAGHQRLQEHANRIPKHTEALKANPNLQDQANFIAKQVQLMKTYSREEQMKGIAKYLAAMLVDLNLWEELKVFIRQVEAIMTNPNLQELVRMFTKKMGAMNAERIFEEQAKRSSFHVQTVQAAQPSREQTNPAAEHMKALLTSPTLRGQLKSSLADPNSEDLPRAFVRHMEALFANQKFQEHTKRTVEQFDAMKATLSLAQVELVAKLIEVVMIDGAFQEQANQYAKRAEAMLSSPSFHEKAKQIAKQVETIKTEVMKAMIVDLNLQKLPRASAELPKIRLQEHAKRIVEQMEAEAMMAGVVEQLEETNVRLNFQGNRIVQELMADSNLQEQVGQFVEWAKADQKSREDTKLNAESVDAKLADMKWQNKLPDTLATWPCDINSKGQRRLGVAVRITKDETSTHKVIGKSDDWAQVSTGMPIDKLIDNTVDGLFDRAVKVRPSPQPFLQPWTKHHSKPNDLGMFLANALGQAKEQLPENWIRTCRQICYKNTVYATQDVRQKSEQLLPAAMLNRDEFMWARCVLIYSCACASTFVLAKVCEHLAKNAAQLALLNRGSSRGEHQYDVSDVAKQLMKGRTPFQQLNQSNVRENVLEWLLTNFDFTPEHVKEVLSCIDHDGDGMVSSVEELREGLDKWWLLSELDDVTLAKVLQETNVTTFPIDWATFEVIIKRLKLSQLLAGPLASASRPKSDVAKAMMERLMVLDYNVQRMSILRVTDHQLHDFFSGRRPAPNTPGEANVRWVHMGSFKLTLLLALTVKYNLHPLGVEDVIEQCPTKIDSYGEKYYFLAVELLCIANDGNGSEPVHVRGRHITMFLSRPPFPHTLITITQPDNSVDKDWPASGSKGRRDPEDGDGWFNKLQDRLRSSRSRLRKGRADSLVYGIIDLCTDELVVVTNAYMARLAFLEDELQVKGVAGLPPDWYREALRAREQLKVVARRLRALQRLVRGVQDLDFSTESSSGYWRDVLDHLGEAQEDVLQLTERSLALATAHQRAVENEQQRRRELQSERTNNILFILTVATTVFTPVQFMTGVYGMNFVTQAGVPTIPELLWRNGYRIFWVVTIVYLVLCGFFSYFLWRYFTYQDSSAGTLHTSTSTPLPRGKPYTRMTV